jgi:cyclophilin family peptidyl-prolyl cis-trans isomerase
MLKGILTLISILGLLFTFSTMNLGQEGNPKVLIKTTKGDITVELNADKAPLSVQNFLSYVDEKFYDGTIFHRVIKGFMIQAGGLSTDLKEKPGKPPIKNEATNGLKNKRGTIALGRTPEIHSATCHFYINHVDNPGLDHRNSTPDGFGYAVFGRVIKGMDVVDAIANAKTMNKYGAADVPRETITIISIRRIQE